MSDFEYTKYTDREQGILAAGLELGPALLALGRARCNAVIRIPTVSHPKEKNGWIRLLPDGRTFSCGNWETYKASVVSDSSSQTQMASIREAEYPLRDEQKEAQAAKAKQAKMFWRRCTPVNREDLHPYLERKQIRPVKTMGETTAAQFYQTFGYLPGESKTERLLVIPLICRGKISSLQLISEQGKKAFLSGGRAGGCYWFSHKARNPGFVAIGEGVATVLSYIQNRPEEMLGIAAMNAGNLPKVAVAIRAEYPDSIVVICGDNDKSGTGQRFALEAQRKLSGKSTIQIPQFSDADRKLFQLITQSNKDPSDWNDFYLIHNAMKAKDKS